jgi:hypothetical protein
MITIYLFKIGLEFGSSTPTVLSVRMILRAGGAVDSKAMLGPTETFAQPVTEIVFCF